MKKFILGILFSFVSLAVAQPPPINVPGGRGGTGSGTSAGDVSVMIGTNAPQFRYLDFTSHTNTTPGVDVSSPLGGTWQFIGNAWTNAQVTNGYLWIDYRRHVSNDTTAASFYMVTTSSFPVVAYIIEYQITNVNPGATIAPATIQIGFQSASNSPDAGSKTFSSGNTIHSSYESSGNFVHQVLSNSVFHTIGNTPSLFRADSSWKRLLIVWPGEGRQRVYGDGFSQNTNSQVTAPVIDQLRPQGTNGPTYLTLQVYNANSTTNVQYNFLIRGIGYGNAAAAAQWITEFGPNPPGTVGVVTNTLATNRVYQAGIGYDASGYQGYYFYWNNSSNLLSIDDRGWVNMGVDPGLNTPLVPSTPLMVSGYTAALEAQILASRANSSVVGGMSIGTTGVPDWLFNMYGGGDDLYLRAASPYNTTVMRLTKAGLVGVNTSPSARLDVLGTVGGSANPIFKAGTNSANGLIVSTNGRVGIGTATPLNALQVSGSVRVESGGEFVVTESGAAANGDRSILIFDAGTPTISTAGGLGFGPVGTDIGSGADSFITRSAAGSLAFSRAANSQVGNSSLIASNSQYNGWSSFKSNGITAAQVLGSITNGDHVIVTLSNRLQMAWWSNNVSGWKVLGP